MNPEMDRVFWLADGVRRYGLVALIGLAAICLMSGNYAPLMERAAERFLESEGKALWQLQERAGAARAALLQVVAEAEQAVQEAEERRRQREEAARRAWEAEQQAAAERQRQTQMQTDYQQSYAENLAAFNAIVARYKPVLVGAANFVAGFEREVEKVVRAPGYFNNAPVTVGEASSFEPCRNPASIDKLFDLDGSRHHNLLACVVYYASNDIHSQSNPLHRHAISAIFGKLKSKDDVFTVPQVFVYHWYMNMVYAANRGDYIPSPPSLFSSDTLSNRLLDGVDSGFVTLLNKTATNAEILLLRDTVHPDMVRLASLAQQMATACRALGISPCIRPVISF